VSHGAVKKVSMKKKKKKGKGRRESEVFIPFGNWVAAKRA